MERQRLYVRDRNFDPYKDVSWSRKGLRLVQFYEAYKDKLPVLVKVEEGCGVAASISNRDVFMIGACAVDQWIEASDVRGTLKKIMLPVNDPAVYQIVGRTAGKAGETGRICDLLKKQKPPFTVKPMNSKIRYEDNAKTIKRGDLGQLSLGNVQYRGDLLANRVVFGEILWKPTAITMHLPLSFLVAQSSSPAISRKEWTAIKKVMTETCRACDYTMLFRNMRKSSEPALAFGDDNAPAYPAPNPPGDDKAQGNRRLSSPTGGASGGVGVYLRLKAGNTDEQTETTGNTYDEVVFYGSEDGQDTYDAVAAVGDVYDNVVVRHDEPEEYDSVVVSKFDSRTNIYDSVKVKPGPQELHASDLKQSPHGSQTLPRPQKKTQPSIRSQSLYDMSDKPAIAPKPVPLEKPKLTPQRNSHEKKTSDLRPETEGKPSTQKEGNHDASEPSKESARATNVNYDIPPRPRPRRQVNVVNPIDHETTTGAVKSPQTEKPADPDPVSPKAVPPSPTSQRISSWADVPKDVKKLNVSQIADCLRLLNMTKFVAAFEEYQVDGTLLCEFVQEELMNEFGLPSILAKKLCLFAKEGWRPVTA